MIFQLSILLILSGLTYVNSLSHELCKSENGYMTLSEKINILSSFKNENGTNTIFIDINQEPRLDEEFNLKCHKNNDIAAKKVLKTADLPWNDLATNTLPHYVKCKDVCEAIIILIEFDATILCDGIENDKNWECGLDKLDKELAPPIFRSSANKLNYLDDDEDIIKKFVIYSATDDLLPIFECSGNSTYCFNPDYRKTWYSNDSPDKIIIEIQSIKNGTVIKRDYGKKFFSSESPDNKIYVPIICVLLGTLFFTAILYFYKQQKSLQPIKCNETKEYDVFISYSSIDKEFVEEYMVPKLEKESSQPKYQCLLHERDFVPGLPIIDQINDAVTKSSCTMIVLSKSFVESKWACQEFDIAIARCKVIVIVKGDIPAKEEMPSNIYNYIQTNTYLSSSDSKFLKKLRDILPNNNFKSEEHPAQETAITITDSSESPDMNYKQWKSMKTGVTNVFHDQKFITELSLTEMNRSTSV